MMHVFHQLPSELFFEIALHLPLINDVLAFSLTNSSVRGALSTPVLFKARLTLRGWDVSAWEDEDDFAQSPGDLLRWMCIDRTYCRIAQLFEEAAVDGYFPVTPSRPTYNHTTHDPGQGNPSPDLRPVFDEDKTAIWLEKLSKVLPLFVTHHRTHFGCIYDIHLNRFLLLPPGGGNISRITEAKYRDVLRTYARFVGDLGTLVRTVRSRNTSEYRLPGVAPEDYSWLERIGFSLIALLIQCEFTYLPASYSIVGSNSSRKRLPLTTSILILNSKNTHLGDASTVRSIFTNFTDTTSGPWAPELLPTAVELEWPPNEPLPMFHAAFMPESISERYFDAFLFQSTFFLKLHLDAARPDTPQPPALLAPLFPHFDPHSSPSYSYFSDSAPVETGSPTTAAPSGVSLSLPYPAPSSPLSHVRPWLRDGLAGTPLAGLSSMTGSAWAGYYTYNHAEERHDPPMYIELRRGPLPSSSDADSHLHGFLGKGHDSVGPFTLSGRCNARTGEVDAIKAYETFQWKWCGVLTPFGMVGIWAPEWRGGRWWIWPREWSPTTSRND
jgi:hypothetical protein